MIRKLFGQRIEKFDPAAVTVRNDAAECDPREAGLTPHDVDAIWAAVVTLYRTRMHPAIALCVRRRGKVVIDRVIGHARGNAPGDALATPKTPATMDTLFNLFSASKAMTAMLIHLLVERSLVNLDAPVAAYIPEFARNGKGGITVRHVLTHRAGIPSVRKGAETLAILSDHARILALLCDARPASRPGHRLAYHAVTGGYLCAEIIRRVTGRDIRSFFADEVLRPLGFKHLNYGVDARDLPRVAEDVYAGPPPPPPIDWLYRRAIGVGWAEAPRLTSDPRFLTAVVPSGNIIGTANEASRYFELLLRGGTLDGVRIFAPETVRRATAETSNLEIDMTLGFPVRYGMGFMLGRNRMSMYGPRTAHVYGHLGFTATLAWADPERDVSACLMTSGKTCVAPGWLDWYEVLSRIARHCAPIR